MQSKTVRLDMFKCVLLQSASLIKYRIDPTVKTDTLPTYQSVTPPMFIQHTYLNRQTVITTSFFIHCI